MIQLNYKSLRNPTFFQAVTKLSKTTEIHDPKTLINVAMIYKYLMEHWVDSDKEWMALLSKFGVSNEGDQIAEDQREEFSKIAKQFEGRDALINRPHLDPANLMLVGLSPAEIVALEPILDMNA